MRQGIALGGRATQRLGQAYLRGRRGSQQGEEKDWPEYRAGREERHAGKIACRTPALKRLMRKASRIAHDYLRGHS